jgi:hypothetical protein
MRNLGRNTTAVLVVTLFTGLAVFSAIQLGGRLFATSSASAQTITTPAAQIQSGNGSGYGESSNGYSDPYGQSSGSPSYSDPYGQGSSSSDTGQTYTCPATGCTASTCHATQQ